MVLALDGKGSRQSARRFLERILTHRTQWDSLITGETYIPMLEKRERQIAAPPSTDSNAQGIPAAGARNDEHVVIASIILRPSLRDPLPPSMDDP